jgi:isopenicillin-N epimerase
VYNAGIREGTMTASRRDFLRGISLATAVPLCWSGLAASLAAAGQPSEGENYWALVRRQFPLREGLIYLNAANVCPASRPVMDRYLEYLRDFQADPSFQNRDKYPVLEERVRAKIAALLKGDADEIALTRNTSEASNIVVRGVDLKAGDEVLITEHNHPSNNDSWRVRARRDGIVVRSVPVPVPPASAGQLAASITSAISPKTKVVSFTHCTNTTGIFYPAREICEEARRSGAWVHVDGAQTFGAVDLDLHRMGCDSYAASAHKWIMGPLEAGILYVRKDRVAQLWPSIVSAHWSDSLATARKFEVFGQRDDPRLVAMEAAVDFVELLGQKNVERRVRFLASHLKSRLGEIKGLRLKTNVEPELSLGVVKFELESVSPERAYHALWARSRISGAVTTAGDASGVRLCPHIYNTLEELDVAARAVAELR